MIAENPAAFRRFISVNSESTGMHGNLQEERRIELSEKTQLLELVDRLDVKTPEIVSAILNGEKITPTMISQAQESVSSSVKTENDMDNPIETINNCSSAN